MIIIYSFRPFLHFLRTIHHSHGYFPDYSLLQFLFRWSILVLVSNWPSSCHHQTSSHQPQIRKIQFSSSTGLTTLLCLITIITLRDDTLLASSVLFAIYYKNQDFLIDQDAQTDFVSLDEQVECVLLRALHHTPNVIIVTNAEVSIVTSYYQYIFLTFCRKVG